ncbi:K+-transporting ATPase ATPase C chain [Granulicella aggregans]|uniref:Potassium-transporting ATPase KdpC subunit n=1 Tax=Granulicella aggregans TaxID=474949 RepID=A0A7W7ZHB2_9BACT|nr:potassium-transporting ATPase subunit KdpC [Granulicella aggregans]MBB5059796.1 K+-transporting ATPase ATPase C chain [Granulicella aggregans]
MRKILLTSILYTVITTILLGIGYPMLVTVIARSAFPKQANGSLIVKNGTVVGSSLIGQPFSGDNYFHSRPSAAGTGYDPTSSGGSNLGPTSKKLVDRIAADTAIAQVDHPGVPVPIDLVTASGSGLDPHITPAAAEYQVARIAKQRKLSLDTVRSLVAEHTMQRTLGLLGEPVVNVLELNLALDHASPDRK